MTKRVDNTPAGENLDEPLGLAETRAEGPRARQRQPETPRPEFDIESPERDLDDLPVIDPDHYILGSYFARGGMGRIAAVRDRRLGRVVALKELIAVDPALVRRFEREIRITAVLQHPSIVNLLEAGRWPGGEPFYAMKKVSGGSLREVIDETGSLDERLGLLSRMIAVAEALAYAHQKRIIHRDLKPDNVLVGEFGETVVIDWGLAKDLARGEDRDSLASLRDAAAANVTMAGSIVGTPGFMAPEQARGDNVDERADVYALGAMLYTTLAGSPPYEGKSAEDILDHVQHREPPPLGERQPGVPDDLQTIVAKAMARRPEDRYPSAVEFAADLQRFHTGQLVAAHKYSRGQLVARWFRRHRAAVVVALAALVALAVIATTSVISVVRERDRALAAERQASERADALVVSQAEAALESEPLLALGALSELSLGSETWPAARMLAAEASARGVPRVLAKPPGGAILFSLSPDASHLAFVGSDETVGLLEIATGDIETLGTHDGDITAVEFSPRGDLIATAGVDNDVILWTPAGEIRRVLEGHEGSVINAAFAPDGEHVVSTSYDRTTRIWNVETGDAHVISRSVDAIDFSEDARSMSATELGEPARVGVWDLEDGRRHFTDEVAGEVLAATLAPDGETLAIAEKTAEGDGAVSLWSVASDAKDTVETVYAGDPVDLIAFSPSGDSLALATREGLLRVIDLETDERWTYRGIDGDVSLWGLEFSPDGAWLLAWADWRSGPIHLLDTGSQSGRPLPDARGRPQFSPQSDRVFSGDKEGRLLVWATSTGGERIFDAGSNAREVAFSPDGELLAAPGPLWDLRLWRLSTDEYRDLRGHRAPVRHVAFSPTGELLASLDSHKRVRLWQADSGESVRLPGRAAQMLAFSPDGLWLAAPGDIDSVRLWDLASGSLRSLEGHDRGVTSVAFSPDGRELASGDLDGELRVWDTDSGRGDTRGWHEGGIVAVSYSPAGDALATGDDEGNVWLWPRDGGEARILEDDAGGWVMTLAFDGRGRRLAAGSSDGAVRIWNLASGEARTLSGHDQAVTRVAFSPDGDTLVSASADETARIWDVQTGASRALRGHGGMLYSAAVSPAGGQVATVAQDGTVRLWRDELPRDPRELRAWLADVTEAHGDESRPAASAGSGWP